MKAAVWYRRKDLRVEEVELSGMKDNEEDRGDVLLFLFDT